MVLLNLPLNFRNPDNFLLYSYFIQSFLVKKKFVVGASCLLSILLMAVFPAKKDHAKSYHTPGEISFFNSHMKTPIDSGEYFLAPVECKGCHGFDSLGLALVDGAGNDVNLFDDWETSMMGLSAVDPLWKAKVSHEILVNPAHADELQTSCTSCHAPMGHFTAFYKSSLPYTLADLATDTLGLAGVACMSCHSLDSVNQGVLFSGNMTYDTTDVAYGPFENPMVGPMQLYVGLTPKYSTHLHQSSFCSPCHTLISNTVDLNGNPTGGTFIEQATYQEWLNSSFPVQEITCQTCHMPQIEDNVKIAVGYTALPGRSPYNLHQFAGANSFMVKLMKDNKSSLGITATDANFDSTLAAIDVMLKKNTLALKAYVDTVMNDTAYVEIQLDNKAGHKFPTGYPARRAVLQVVAVKSNGDTLFSSGLFDDNFEVKFADSVAEKHYDVIRDPSEVQLYEMVMADVNGNKTTVLERAATVLKDNRIPPVGFTTLHNSYDTCFIAGDALTDINFNKSGSIEGTGKDIVNYHIPLYSYLGTVTIYATMFYQAVPPGWLTEMSSFSSAEIDTFMQMYAAADRSPVFIASDTIQNLLINTGISGIKDFRHVTVMPNPSVTGKIRVDAGESFLLRIDLFNAKGKKINTFNIPDQTNTFEFTLPDTDGIYLLHTKTKHGSFTTKVLRLHP